MLETLMENQIIFYAMGAVAGLGVLSRLISHFTIGRLVRAAGKMNKSNHKFMRLIKAKYEHVSMISDRVENVEAFLKKYIYEYRVFGIRLHTWRSLQMTTVWFIGILGSVWTAVTYYWYGAGDRVLSCAAYTAGSVVLLLLLHLSGDEKFQMQMLENYMIDFLENVYAHRYARTHRQNELRQAEIVEMEEGIRDDEPAEAMGEAEAAVTAAAEEEEAKKERFSQEVRIREILEEFLA